MRGDKRELRIKRNERGRGGAGKPTEETIKQNEKQTRLAARRKDIGALEAATQAGNAGTLTHTTQPRRMKVGMKTPRDSSVQTQRAAVRREEQRNGSKGNASLANAQCRVGRRNAHARSRFPFVSFLGGPAHREKPKWTPMPSRCRKERRGGGGSVVVAVVNSTEQEEAEARAGREGGATAGETKSEEEGMGGRGDGRNTDTHTRVSMPQKEVIVGSKGEDRMA